MRSLYLRIWLTVVAALLLFALVAGWLVQRTLEQERSRTDSAVAERIAAWGELIQRSLPTADAPADEQAAALRDWSQRLRLPLALDDRDGRRLAVSEAYQRREAEPGPRRAFPIRLEDGRTLWLMRPLRPSRPGGAREGGSPRWLPLLPGLNALPGVGLAALLALLFAAVAAGAYPVVRRLTRRLETLQRGVDAFGQGALHQRVAESGRDEVAALGASFNRAATRIEALLRSHQSLLANASHELRSPLARLKMALSMLDDAAPAQRQSLQREIATDIGELDTLVEEILLASRLDATADVDKHEPVDLLALAAEEASRTGALVEGEALVLSGDERLLRRALRNLLENARRYGGGEAVVSVRRVGGAAELRVCDRGPGVPEALRERIFEPFFRLPGHAEHAGGSGLGLALVRQIARRHGARVHCEPRDGGGSCFVFSLPA